MKAGKKIEKVSGGLISDLIVYNNKECRRQRMKEDQIRCGENIYEKFQETGV